jgi:hypothetical protein
VATAAVADAMPPIATVPRAVEITAGSFDVTMLSPCAIRLAAVGESVWQSAGHFPHARTHAS